MNQLESAIIKTLCYSDIFSFPLTQPEIFQYLIWESSKPSPSKKDLIPVLFKLTQDQTIFQTEGYFHLPSPKNQVTLRKNRQRASLPKLKQAQRVSDKLSKIPSILGIFLTGAVAMQNANKSDDIDLMIVVSQNQLWSTRLKAIRVLNHLGIRRKPHQKQVSNLICANMYMDEVVLTISRSKQSIYTAHEVIQAKPLLERHQIYQRFLKANNWITSYLPNFSIPKKAFTSLSPNSPTTYEKLAFKAQYLYMKSKITRETITPHLALFHPRNTQQSIMQSYEQRLKTYGLA